ncbi:MAG TPA: ferritin-like domain-containing protein [Myxococcota bacterium]|nr:ferritin-like domain-containing protein [Myxococcota bacterium]
MAEMRNLRDMLVEELRDIYHAEKQITKALPKMVKAATSEQLKAGFEKHLEETHGQIERLEQCFELLDAKVRGKACEAMRGIIEEASDTMKEDMEPEVLDAALVASAQKVEHYEIASYGTVMTWANNLGLDKVAKLLSATLDEEKATDVKLTQLATQDINARAAKAGMAA